MAAEGPVAAARRFWREAEAAALRQRQPQPQPAQRRAGGAQQRGAGQLGGRTACGPPSHSHRAAVEAESKEGAADLAALGGRSGRLAAQARLAERSAGSAAAPPPPPGPGCH